MKPHPLLALAVINLAWTTGLIFQSAWRGKGEDNTRLVPIALSLADNGRRIIPDTRRGAAPFEFEPGHLTAPSRFQWAEIESSDYRTFTDNLRAIGCPTETIRDIIFADLQETLRRQIDHSSRVSSGHVTNVGGNREVSSSDQVETEIRQIMIELGLAWPTWTMGCRGPSPVGSERAVGAFGGAEKLVLAEPDIPAAVSTEGAEQNLDSNEIEPAVLADLDAARRVFLADAPLASERDEFDLRYSEAALSLRESLGGLEVTAEEFRALYKNRQEFDAALEAESNGANPLDPSRFEVEIERILGPERVAVFRGASSSPLRAPAR